ncbi:T9SS type A sorting domain-containing protein [Dyadobacter aurulentus]|uniref:T9SS type A sorting domain-containing protein n=1 Tax=Dyadobacter sp. UC 10 TaxID=2605428 RepID=UPI0011F3C482|nr:T9SS type A sorting domain-containing protein [Dyadobacter sp. UC 10]KAA0993765.1 T9SS type A sorting domain-containing protein [Dyadobacter sp. UC 10]
MNLLINLFDTKKQILKNLLYIFMLLCLATPGQAQRFNSVVFQKLPQDLQLYPRDEKSEATVPISGIVEAAGWNYIAVQITRNNAPFKYLRANLTYQAGVGKFATETKIKAELAGYDFAVYVVKGSDSVLVVTRKDVVSGDVYVLSGQSNSTGFFTEKDTTRFCRTFGKITENLNTSAYNPADTLWAFSNQHEFRNGVGTMGFEIQKQLMQKSGIPNCLINAGFHWSSAFDHAKRNENNPADLNTGYGRMLYRIQKGGLSDAVKAYIFRQGETEAYHEGGNWQGNFDLLRKHLKEDFANLARMYVYQIDIIYFASPVGAEIRDYQRRLPEIYPDVTSLATVGTAEFDGLHYGREGNRQNGFELSRIMLKDFYNAADTSNILSPSLQKVFFKNEEKKQLVLVFDEGQSLVYPEPYRTTSGVTLQMKDFFYLDWESGKVASGKAEGNRVLLELTSPQNAGVINYLPMYVPEGGPYFPFMGPYIKNSKGMRAMTFYNVPIGTALATPALTAEKEGDAKVKLSWKTLPGANQYVLERKYPDQQTFTSVASLDSAITQFVDQPEPADTITYRLKAVGKISESADFAYANIALPIVLGIEKEPGALFSVYPNPAIRNQKVQVKFNKPVSGKLSVINLGGQSILETQVTNEREVSIGLPVFQEGVHVIRLRSGEQEWSKKILVR